MAPGAFFPEKQAGYSRHGPAPRQGLGPRRHGRRPASAHRLRLRRRKGALRPVAKGPGIVGLISRRRIFRRRFRLFRKGGVRAGRPGPRFRGFQAGRRICDVVHKFRGIRQFRLRDFGDNLYGEPTTLRRDISRQRRRLFWRGSRPSTRCEIRGSRRAARGRGPGGRFRAGGQICSRRDRFRAGGRICDFSRKIRVIRQIGFRDFRDSSFRTGVNNFAAPRFATLPFAVSEGVLAKNGVRAGQLGPRSPGATSPKIDRFRAGWRICDSPEISAIRISRFRRQFVLGEGPHLCGAGFRPKMGPEIRGSRRAGRGGGPRGGICSKVGRFRDGRRICDFFRNSTSDFRPAGRGIPKFDFPDSPISPGGPKPADVWV